MMDCYPIDSECAIEAQYVEMIVREFDDWYEPPQVEFIGKNGERIIIALVDGEYILLIKERKNGKK